MSARRIKGRKTAWEAHQHVPKYWVILTFPGTNERPKSLSPQWSYRFFAILGRFGAQAEAEDFTPMEPKLLEPVHDPRPLGLAPIPC
jgi:hypothetical protein